MEEKSGRKSLTCIMILLPIFFLFFLPSIHSTQTVAVPTCDERLRLKKQDKIS